MKTKSQKKHLLLISLILSLVLFTGSSATLAVHASSQTQYFTGEVAEYYQSLLNIGFPASYAQALTELHLLHPDWEFVPLKITEGNSDYTWSYVINRETEVEDRNLIYSSDTYKAYRHPTNTTLYDSGYYQASRNTIEYFMDPRNFLNETDIFQFYDLSTAVAVKVEAINAVLDGTFMESGNLENGMTYAEYFLSVGETLGINPLFLAVKARQEQGAAGTSPIISGTCGSLLNTYYLNHTQTSESGNRVLAPSSGYTSEQLLALNGYYNLFNINATGNGLFAIYFNAMGRAKTGNPEMASTWGSASWNTVWKSVYGGANILKQSYIDRYQASIYLQKFNVDSRASDRNFWGQYMQNVAGAMTESRTFYTALAASDSLDGAYVFQIPVYEGMPNEPCADPANGTCTYLATAPNKYGYSSLFTSPVSKTASDSALYIGQALSFGETLTVSGTVSHSYGVRALEYRLDHGDWITASNNETVNLSIPIDFSEGSSHILVIRGLAAYNNTDSQKKNNHSFLCAVIYIDVLEPQTATLALKSRTASSKITYTVGTELFLPDADADDFVGWLGSNGTLLPASAKTVLENDISYTAVYLSSQILDGAALVFSSDDTPTLRFSAVISQVAYDQLTKDAKTMHCYAVISTAGTKTVKSATAVATVSAFDENWMRLAVDTDAIASTAYQTDYTVTFYADVTYSNGTQSTLVLSETAVTRNAKEVATAALADGSAAYSQTVRSYLEQIAN